MANILIWTTLPAGVRWKRLPNGTQQAILSLALLASPRLDLTTRSAGTLNDEEFRDFLDWPARLLKASYALRIKKGSLPTGGDPDLIQQSATPVTDAARVIDPRFWTTIFDPATVVRPYTATTAAAVSSRVTSYDAALLDDALVSGYFAQLSTVRRLRGEKDDLAENPLVRSVAALFHPDKARALGDTIGKTFGRFRTFHERASASAAAAAMADGSHSGAQHLEFHELLSALQEHSMLMRKLGLVIDFEIPLSAEQLSSIGSEGIIKVEVSGLPLLKPTVHFNPWTAFSSIPRAGSSDYGIFHPRRKDVGGGPDWGGFRSLTVDTARVTTHELDASANNIIGLAIHANESAQEAFDYTARPEMPLHLPALRQGGLAIIDLPNTVMALTETDVLPVEKDIAEAQARQQLLEGRLAVASAVAVPALASTEEVLYQEDGLVRGYRVDVLDKSKSVWRSLCRRTPAYRFTRAPLKGTALENWLPGADEGEITKVVTYQPEAAKPARVSPYLANWDGWSLVVPRPGKPVDADGKPVIRETPSIQNFEFQVSVPPKTLEVKRFGRVYRIRVRTVDLGGNSWTIDEATALLGSGTLNVGIIEKANLRVAPVRAPALLEDGVGLDGEKGEVLVVRQLDQSGPRASVRHIVPPDVSERFAEEHGVFDAMTDRQAYEVFKATQGSYIAGAAGSLAAYRQNSGRLRVPYLPDPLSRAAVLKDVSPGSGSAIVTFPSQPDSIPAAKSILLESIVLRLLPGPKDSTPSVQTKSGEIIVYMPPGHRLPARLCTSIPADKFDMTWLSDPQASTRSLVSMLGAAFDTLATSQTLPAALRSAVTSGEEPIFTPERNVTFVYATQRPVNAPKYGNDPKVARRLNEVGAELVDFDFYLHIASTGRVEFTAAWEDIIDEPGTTQWRSEKGALAPFGYNLAETDQSALGKPNTPLSYWIDDPAAGTSAVKQKRRDETKRRQAPTAHAFKDTKFREVVYTARAVSRFGAFMPERIRGDTDAQSRSVRSPTLAVLNTAAPMIPAVRHILPTFRQTSQDPKVRKHVGGGLRIYLERPWFSSGRGEKLAVLLYPADLTSAPAELSNFVTEWGFNPRKLGGATTARPVLEDFGGAHDRVVASTLTLYSGQKADPDIGGVVPPPLTANISMATYDVHLDGTNDVLYCDLEVNPGRAYFPCLRLALARYQEKSVEGASLSPVVLADFIQLSPHRSVSVVKAVNGKHKIAVSGVSYLDVEYGLTTSVIEVLIQRRRSNIQGREPVWETTSPAATTLQAERVGSETMLWTGEIAEPSGGDWRIVLVEYEYYSVDQNARTRPGQEVVTIGGRKMTRRQIFSDSIEIRK